VLGGQRAQRAVGQTLELDEDVVPDLDHVRVALVHHRAGVAAADAVVVDLRARPARPRVAHFPEVVLHVPGQHVAVGEELEPQLPRLLVGGQAQLRIALEVGRVQPVAGDAVDLREQLPRPLHRFLLEVVAEGPVAQHLEERVVVRVLAHVVEVVVLAARADALLTVHRPLELAQVRRRVRLAQEDGLELVHPRVGEQERGIVEGHAGVAGHEGVPARRAAGLALEELDERGADLVGGGHDRDSYGCS
jgi:hypothetical protein